MERLNRRRGGLTVLELLVVVVLIGILVAVILPAVLRARDAARRAQCANNLRQLAVAVTQFEGARQRLPNSGTFGVQTLSGGAVVIDYFQPKRSWVVGPLPFIDRNDNYDRWTFQTPHPAAPLMLA